ncbi:MAG: uncharacterized protein JWM10_17 [Myxococcaceae bacterium]|nr:uncharacterized protein [Myxococcaceae bacterium]
MATAVGTQSDLGDLLHQLIELDYDAIEAYRTALARFEDTGFRSQMSSFQQDHERHVHELSVLLRAMGREPPEGPDMKQYLTKGKVVIAGLLGDPAVLAAMITNEDDTNTAYERAAARVDLSTELRELVEHNLADERRHREWLREKLAASRASAP